MPHLASIRLARSLQGRRSWPLWVAVVWLGVLLGSVLAIVVIVVLNLVIPAIRGVVA